LQDRDETYVADIDDVAFLNTTGGVVSERVRGHRGVAGIMETASSGGSSTISTTTSAIAESTTTSTEPAATKAAAEASTSASKTAAAIATGGAHGRAGKTILTDLEHAALPVIAVELLNSVARIFGGFEDDDAGALRSTVRAEMDIGANNATCAS
jgi:hypothetical protein